MHKNGVHPTRLHSIYLFTSLSSGSQPPPSQIQSLSGTDGEDNRDGESLCARESIGACKN